MDVELVSGRNLIRRAEMQQVSRPSPLRKVTGVLDEGIQWFCKLSIKKKSGFPGEVARTGHGCWPVQCELSIGAPIGRKLSRPGQLKSGGISVTRHRLCSRGDA